MIYSICLLLCLQTNDDVVSQFLAKSATLQTFNADIDISIRRHILVLSLDGEIEFDRQKGCDVVCRTKLAQREVFKLHTDGNNLGVKLDDKEYNSNEGALDIDGKRMDITFISSVFNTPNIIKRKHTTFIVDNRYVCVQFMVNDVYVTFAIDKLTNDLVAYDIKSVTDGKTILYCEIVDRLGGGFPTKFKIYHYKNNMVITIALSNITTNGVLR